MITDGVLGPGATLPAERKLAQDLGISRKTVQQCYDALRQQRLVSAHGRNGYIVEDGFRRIKPGMERLKGFTEEMHELGRVPSSRILERTIGEDRSIASIFGLSSTARFLRLVRVRMGDGIPLSVEKAWDDLGLAPGLAEVDLSGVHLCPPRRVRRSPGRLRANHRGRFPRGAGMRDLRLFRAASLPADQAPLLRHRFPLDRSMSKGSSAAMPTPTGCACAHKDEGNGRTDRHLLFWYQSRVPFLFPDYVNTVELLILDPFW